ncbi:3-oxo-5-alpha-steroid 4-dehydrogenase-domain-containing protein [Boletus reticuloceps]|uniref:3-oxo-5-alpha-steroid 4-dehydrogenase-domain-containing protein n=1 Tax=Boletus reticuloceps TaxID=495285 RepID=A0A8I2YD00_9AGAM|nr:3-oxo-5-alpha-steroid 4-dehydrogenase-domain-containing protein [Boletus reticuloceps]
MVSVTVSPAGKPISIARGLPSQFDIPGKDLQDATIGDVKVAIAKKFPKFYSARQKITLKDSKNVLNDEVTLVGAGVADGGELSVKDIGHQISWKTVFLIEYAGPLLIHPIFYYFPEYIWGGPVYHSMLQRFVYALVMLHFAKRELETLFIHRFSHDTMPVKNIFRNSSHYYIGSGLFLALAIYGPQYSAMSPYIRGTSRDDPVFIWACTAIWLFAEVSNLITHITLRSLRPAGSRKRAIPQGYGFSLVSFPNYFFESLGWFAIALMTGSWIGEVSPFVYTSSNERPKAYGFVIVSTAIMYTWAAKKHAAYKKEFGSTYPKGRKAMFPFIA